MGLFRNALPPQITADEWGALLRAITMSVLAVMLCLALCISLFFKNYVDPVVLTTVMGLATFVLGYLAGKRTPITEQPNSLKEPEKPTTE
jgi:uncharacterized membrane protein (DUF4010 family)